jgi:20S proteasome alpha/beta subunit
MTIAVGITVSEGIVLAADSRQSYTNSQSDVRVSSDYARKVFQLGPCAGAVTWGWAFLQGRNIYSHVNEYTLGLASRELPVEALAKGLGEYLHKLYKGHISKKYGKAVEKDSYALGLLVAGYDPGGQVGKVFEVYIPEGEYYERYTTNANPGAMWRGQTVAISRLIKGYDPRLRQVKGATARLQKTIDQDAPLDYAIDYWGITLQDAIDLGIFFVHTTIQIGRFTDGIRIAPGDSATCGGPIDVIVLEPEHGLQWIQRKALHGERANMAGGNET